MVNMNDAYAYQVACDVSQFNEIFVMLREKFSSVTEEFGDGAATFRINNVAEDPSETIRQVFESKGVTEIKQTISFPENMSETNLVSEAASWQKHILPVLVVVFSVLMNAAHMMGYFHCLHAPLSHMMFCGALCTFVMFYSGYDYLRDTFLDVLALWPMYTTLTMSLYFGFMPAMLVLPYMLYRHICTDVKSNHMSKVVDVLLLVLLSMPQLTTQMLILQPLATMIAMSYHEQTQASIARRSMGLTLFVTGSLSWLSIFYPAVMHANGIHVFFHDALLFLGVYEIGKVIRGWVKDQAKVFRERMTSVFVYSEQDKQWHHSAYSEVGKDSYVYLESGRRVLGDAVVVKVEQEDAQYTKPQQEDRTPLRKYQILSSDSTVHSPVILRKIEDGYQHPLERSDQQQQDPRVAVFYKYLMLYIMLVAIALSFTHPSLIMPVTSALFLGACPCVFTVARPMIDVMFFYLLEQTRSFKVQKMPSLWEKPKHICFDRTNTIAFSGPNSGEDSVFGIRDAAKELIDWLIEQGSSVSILTAQKDKGRITEMQNSLNKNVNVMTGMNDTMKGMQIKAYKKSGVVMMVGDGENDVMALEEAQHSLGHQVNDKVMQAANTTCNLQNADLQSYFKFLFDTCDTMSTLTTMALWYNVALLSIVGILPIFTGGIAIQPYVCCMFMTIGSAVQVSGAYIWMKQSAHEHFKIEQDPLPGIAVKPFEQVASVCKQMVESVSKRFSLSG